MKKYLLIITVIFLSALTFLLLTRYNNSDNSKLVLKGEAVNETPAKPDDDDCCKPVKITEGSYTDMSVYLQEGKWTNQGGKIVELGKFKNKKVILAMFFASCQSACPVIVNNMKIIESKISRDKLNDYKFVLVSFDPDRDTPSVLKKYAEDYNLNSSSWTLLTGNKSDIMELAMMIGLKYSKNESGGFTHTNLISFLNSKGEIVSQNDGLVLDMNNVNKTITSLNKNKSY